MTLIDKSLNYIAHRTTSHLFYILLNKSRALKSVNKSINDVFLTQFNRLNRYMQRV